MTTKTVGHTPGPSIVSPARFDRPVSGGPVTFTFYVRTPDRRGNSQSLLKESYANARLIAAAPELLKELRALAHLAETLNNRQRAGLEITATMWSELYRQTQDARAAIVKAEGDD